jgi:hypothetical protein
MSKANAIVSVAPAMRMATRAGFDPYDNHAEVAHAYGRYAAMCGAVPLTDAETADVLDSLNVPGILRRQA